MTRSTATSSYWRWYTQLGGPWEIAIRAVRRRSHKEGSS